MAWGALLIATAASAQRGPTEDEAHRLDRLQTQALNASALSRLAAPPAPAPARPRIPAPVQRVAPGIISAEDALRTREDRALAAWRARVAACRAGDRKACDRRRPALRWRRAPA